MLNIFVILEHSWLIHDDNPYSLIDLKDYKNNNYHTKISNWINLIYMGWNIRAKLIECDFWAINIFNVGEWLR